MGEGTRSLTTTMVTMLLHQIHHWQIDVSYLGMSRMVIFNSETLTCQIRSSNYSDRVPSEKLSKHMTNNAGLDVRSRSSARFKNTVMHLGSNFECCRPCLQMTREIGISAYIYAIALTTATTFASSQIFWDKASSIFWRATVSCLFPARKYKTLHGSFLRV